MRRTGGSGRKGIDKRKLIAVLPFALMAVGAGALFIAKKGGISLPGGVQKPALQGQAQVQGQKQTRVLVDGWLIAWGTRSGSDFVPVKVEAYRGTMDPSILRVPQAVLYSTSQVANVFFYVRSENDQKMNLVMEVDWEAFRKRMYGNCRVKDADEKFFETPYAIYMDGQDVKSGYLRPSEAVYAASVPVQAGYHSISIVFGGGAPIHMCRDPRKPGNVAVVPHISLRVGYGLQTPEPVAGYIEDEKWQKYGVKQSIARSTNRSISVSPEVLSRALSPTSPPEVVVGRSGNTGGTATVSIPKYDPTAVVGVPRKKATVQVKRRKEKIREEVVVFEDMRLPPIEFEVK